MFSDKRRVAAYIKTSIDEMELIDKMSQPINEPKDFGIDISGMTIFRACSMSLQYITENFIKIRNLTSEAFFERYKSVPWKSVFGMRNFLAHEYADVDDDAIFRTIKKDLPTLLDTARQILSDLNKGDLDSYFNKDGDSGG